MLIEEKGVCRCRSKRAGRTPTASTGISAISTTTRMSNKPLVISSTSRDGCGEIPKWRDSSTRCVAITTRFRRVGRTGFYGLDLHSLHASMKAVEDFLERVGPTAAERARTRTPASTISVPSRKFTAGRGYAHGQIVPRSRHGPTPRDASAGHRASPLRWPYRRRRALLC